MVMLEAGLKPPRKGNIERLFVLVLRLLALFALIAGLNYWAKLTGIATDGAMRFDLLAAHVRIVYTTLAVLLPVAALGLWLTARWGVVLWVIATTAEIVTHGLLGDAYPARPGIAALGVLSLVVLVIVSAATLIERRATRHIAP